MRSGGLDDHEGLHALRLRKGLDNRGCLHGMDFGTEGAARCARATTRCDIMQKVVAPSPGTVRKASRRHHSSLHGGRYCIVLFFVPDTYEQRVATGLRGLQLRHSCTYTRANPPTVPQPEGCAGSTGAARAFHAYPVNSCRGAPGGSWRHHRLENKLALMTSRVPQPHVPRRENAIAAVAGSKRPHLTPRLHRDVCFFSSPRSKFFRSRDGCTELHGTS